jgi:cell wall assembly regulator SMI1
LEPNKRVKALMQELWDRINARLSALNPDVSNSFNPPAINLAALETLVPKSQTDFYAWYSLADGQDSGQTFVDHWVMLPIDEILDRYRLMNVELAEEWKSQGVDLEEGESIGPVKPLLWSEHWIPFAEKGMDYLCLDLDPDEGGTVGQIILYSREPEPVEWVSESLRALMSSVAERLEGSDVKLSRQQQIELGWIA